MTIPAAFATSRYRRVRHIKGDPAWLVNGIVVAGRSEIFYTMHAAAAALGRNPNMVRQLERSRVLPPCRFRMQTPDPRHRFRLWTREELLAIAQAVDDLGLRNCRPQNWFDVGLRRQIELNLAALPRHAVTA